jgi:hypothetical protein
VLTLVIAGTSWHTHAAHRVLMQQALLTVARSVLQYPWHGHLAKALAERQYRIAEKDSLVRKVQRICPWGDSPGR